MANSISQANTATTRYLEADGVRFAYRSLGTDRGVPLVLLQRFRGTMDEWDPLLLDRLAERRRVVLFDNAGVSLSSGEAPPTIAGMAERAAAFIAALGAPQVDLLGWSMGGAVAQQLALERPGTVRKLVLAATSPGGAPGTSKLSERVLETMRKPVNDDEDFLYLFFHDSPASRAAGRDHLSRLYRRTEPAAPRVKPETVRAQLQAIAGWASGGGGSAYARLSELEQPALVANGTRDVMIDPRASYAIAERMPNADLQLYAGAGHGFLFQYPERFADQVLQFLDQCPVLACGSATSLDCEESFSRSTPRRRIGSAATA